MDLRVRPPGEERGGGCIWSLGINAGLWTPEKRVILFLRLGGDLFQRLL